MVTVGDSLCGDCGGLSVWRLWGTLCVVTVGDSLCGDCGGLSVW